MKAGTGCKRPLPTFRRADRPQCWEASSEPRRGSLAKQGSKHARATVSQASMNGSAVLIRVPVPPHPLEVQQVRPRLSYGSRQPARRAPSTRPRLSRARPAADREGHPGPHGVDVVVACVAVAALGLNDLPIPLDMFSAADLRFDPVVRYAASCLRALLRKVWLRTRGRRATAAARGRLWLRLKRALPLGNGRDRH